MKAVAVLAVHFLAAACHARELKQTRYDTVSEALQAAGGSRVSTLIAAVQAAGLSIPADATWTIFAPTNEAFSDDDIRETTGLTAAQLLEPANKQALTDLLSYHVVPSGALRAAQLTDSQQLTTALAGAAPLRVDIDDDGGVEIEVSDSGDDDDGDDADVVTADVLAGNSVIHVIDEVLIPSSLRSARTGRRLLDDDDDDDKDDDIDIDNDNDDNNNNNNNNTNSNDKDNGNDDKNGDNDDDDDDNDDDDDRKRKV